MLKIIFVILFLWTASQQDYKSPSGDDSKNSVTWRLDDSVTSCTVTEPVEATSENKSENENKCESENVVQVSTSPSPSISYYKSQIRIADSLYKNYLPQYNFDEVKAAVAFFERISGTPELQNSGVPEIRKSSAKAHYYHAVGLTERDDIVGACEHYLRALEIMEPLVGTPEIQNSGAPEIRFLALIYTRLGRLFYNENYCDLAITKYKKALKYVEIIDEKPFKANVLKELGNSYQLINEPDSALYYYNESLKYNSSLSNKLDVEKSIAQILFNEGERDSAYMLLKNNLCKIENYTSKDSYYGVLGEMFYKDMLYDSAICYLEKSVTSNEYYIKYMSSTILSSIYESLGDFDRKAYYDNVALKLYGEESNKVVEKNKIQYLYDKYKERKLENEKIRNRNKILVSALSLLAFVFLIFIVVLTLIRCRYKRKSMKFLDIIDSNNDVINQIREDNEVKQSKILEYSRTIEENEESIALLEQELKNKEMLLCDFSEQIEKTKAEINEIRETLENKENNIIALKKEIKRIRQYDSKENKTINIESYYSADICQMILKRKESDFSPLSEDELALLLQAADDRLGNYTKKLKEQYPRLTKDDLYCICLLLLNINKNRLYHLLGRNRKTIWERINRIKNIMNIGDDDDLFLSIKGGLYK